ncbi:MAG: biotin-dependent carboxyltransferase family protein [Geodermatophilaceae bacterium]|nr:biotin-dependent carboxyltransferase family protein [Geodermatophilaceae bacterium]
MRDASPAEPGDERRLLVLHTGPLTTVQDAGRPGFAQLGIGRSGAADRGSHRLANRLVGNLEDDATLEVTLGGLVVRADHDLLIAVTGAPAPITVGAIVHGANAPLALRSGEVAALGSPPRGMRSYVAVRGGVRVQAVLGSRSTDLLSGIGPDPLRVGDIVPIGTAYGAAPDLDLAAVAEPTEGELTLSVRVGPRADWFTDTAMHALLHDRYEVTGESNRVGMRLSGPILERSRPGELPSEGMVVGALQVSPDGQPTLFLADHPVTGGYPVIAVVDRADVDAAAQARPGQHLRFRPAGDPAVGPAPSSRPAKTTMEPSAFIT